MRGERNLDSRSINARVCWISRTSPAGSSTSPWTALDSHWPATTARGTNTATYTIGYISTGRRKERSRLGLKPEREAEETGRYETLEGALACLIDDCNVVGLTAAHDHPRLL